MELLNEQFELAIQNVSVKDKSSYVVKAHLEVRALLEADPVLKAWGIDTILIGSYARDTSRYPAKDADVFLRFTGLTVQNDPAQVYAAVADVLIKKYRLAKDGGRVTPQARSLKIDFPSPTSQADLSFSVDAVPAVRWGDAWGIPNRDPSKWSADDSRWIRTNPIAFTDKTDELSTSKSSPAVGARNAYRPIVRLLRQCRYIHLDEDRPGGLYVEVLAYYAWRDGLVAGDQWGPLLASSLRQVSVAMRACAGSGLTDPVLGTKMSPALTSDQWISAANRFERLADLADRALTESRCMAAKIWREVLGTNERGQVFPLPSGCDAGGFPLASITSVGAVGSTESRGFAHASG